MIKNERQYEITRKQAERFRAALAESPPHSEGQSLLQRAQHDALASQFEELDYEVKQYERLKEGGVRVFEATALGELPSTLIRARIALGLTQADLARRLGIQEQQVQRYEATDYASASFSRLRDVADSLGVLVTNDVFVVGDITGVALLDKLSHFGFERSFVERRLIPISLRGQVEETSDRASLLRAASFAAKALDVPLSEILADDAPRLDLRPLATVRHKLSKSAHPTKVGLYTVYAHYLALLALEASRPLHQRTTPEDTDELHDAIVEAYGRLDYASTLRYVWDDLGIPVLPLKLHGGFHGATWRIGGENVVVLNPAQSYPAYWLNDLLHEVGHTGQEPEEGERSVVEVEPVWESRDESPDEIDARLFAVDTTFRSRGDALARECETIARSVEGLKSAVARVAGQEGVLADSLALHMAYRVTSTSWWGAATNLQIKDVDGFEIARAAFLERADLSRLSPDEREMLLLGIQGDGDGR